MTSSDGYGVAAQRFVTRLQSGDFAGAAGQVSPEVPAGAMGAQRLEQIWTQLTAQLGTLSDLAAGSTVVEGAQIDLAIDDGWVIPGGGRESSGLIRRCASRDRSAVCCVSFRASFGRHIRRGAGRSDVRYARTDRVAYGAHPRARGRNAYDATG